MSPLVDSRAIFIPDEEPVDEVRNAGMTQAQKINRQISLEVRAALMRNCQQLQSTLTALLAVNRTAFFQAVEAALFDRMQDLLDQVMTIFP
ncbi:unnamed protein product [Caenorhabditis nigoni]